MDKLKLVNEIEIEIKDDYSKNELEKIIDKFVEIMEKMTWKMMWDGATGIV